MHTAAEHAWISLQTNGSGVTQSYQWRSHIITRRAHQHRLDVGNEIQPVHHISESKHGLMIEWNGSLLTPQGGNLSLSHQNKIFLHLNS